MIKCIKIVTYIVTISLLCVVLDLLFILFTSKPIFVVKHSCDDCISRVYYGIFYDTYICDLNGKPQIKAKWTKYSCSDLAQNNYFEIIDTTEVCAEALEGIYKDNTGEYYLPCMKSQNISIKFSDGRTYSLKYVLENDILTIHELIDGGLEVYRY